MAEAFELEACAGARCRNHRFDLAGGDDGERLFVNHKHSKQRALLLALPLAILQGPVATRSAQSPAAEVVDALDYRPLDFVVEELQRRHGWIVTYEDPFYLHSTEVQMPPRGRSGRLLGPPGLHLQSFRFEYSRDVLGRLDPEVILQSLVERYNQAGMAGRFRLIRTEDMFHIVPTMNRDSEGVWRPRPSLLDVRVSIPAKERTLLELLDEVFVAVTRQSGMYVAIATGPTNTLISTRLSSGSNDEVARTVILRALRASGRNDLSWKLLCAGLTDRCFFNLTVLPRRDTN